MFEFITYHTQRTYSRCVVFLHQRLLEVIGGINQRTHFVITRLIARRILRWHASYVVINVLKLSFCAFHSPKAMELIEVVFSSAALVEKRSLTPSCTAYRRVPSQSIALMHCRPKSLPLIDILAACRPDQVVGFFIRLSLAPVVLWAGRCPVVPLSRCPVVPLSRCWSGIRALCALHVRTWLTGPRSAARAPLGLGVCCLSQQSPVSGKVHSAWALDSVRIALLSCCWVLSMFFPVGLWYLSRRESVLHRVSFLYFRSAPLVKMSALVFMNSGRSLIGGD